MAFCPVCKNEYRPGFTTCSDCKVALVDSLELAAQAVIMGEKALLDEITNHLIENQIMSAKVIFITEQDAYQLFLDQGDLEKGIPIIQAFLSMKHEEMEDNSALFGYSGRQLLTPRNHGPSSSEGQEVKQTHVFVDKKSKATEYKGSAYVLFFTGLIGNILLVLHGFGLLPIYVNPNAKILVYSVLGLLFTIFMIVGITSYKTYKTLSNEVGEEATSMEQIKSFLTTEFSMDKMNQMNIPDTLSEEEKYFFRMERVKDMTIMTFPNCDESMLEELLDDWYHGLYEN